MVSRETIDELFRRMLEDPENSNCVDCGAQNPTHISLQHGVFICENCAAQHITLGPDKALVMSKDDNWTIKQLKLLTAGGNSSFKNFFQLYNIPADSPPLFKYQTVAALYYRALLESVANGTECQMQQPTAEQGLQSDAYPELQPPQEHPLPPPLPPQVEPSAPPQQESKGFFSNLMSSATSQLQKIQEHPKIKQIEEYTMKTANQIGEKVQQIYETPTVQSIVSHTKAAASYIGHEAAVTYERINTNPRVQQMKADTWEFLEKAEQATMRQADKAWNAVTGSKQHVEEGKEESKEEGNQSN